MSAAVTLRGKESCWKRRSEEKKKLRTISNVEIPQEAFLAVLDRGHRQCCVCWKQEKASAAFGKENGPRKPIESQLEGRERGEGAERRGGRETATRSRGAFRRDRSTWKEISNVTCFRRIDWSWAICSSVSFTVGAVPHNTIDAFARLEGVCCPLREIVDSVTEQRRAMETACRRRRSTSLELFD